MVDNRLSAVPLSALPTPGLRTQTLAVSRLLRSPSAWDDGAITANRGAVRARFPAAELFGPSRAERQAAFNSVPGMLWTATADGRVDFYNDRCRSFLGPTPGGRAMHWISALHPEDAAAALEQWQLCSAAGSSFEAEYRIRRHDGDFRWAQCRAAPDLASDGSLRGWVGSFADIDALKCGLEKSQLIAGEMVHRMQNIFAVVGALLALSARTEPQAQNFADAARARFGALARAQEIINPIISFGCVPASSQTTTVQELLRILLAPYQQTLPGQDDRQTIQITGAECMVGSEAVVGLALLIHELASNALKHGALTAVGGVVHVTVHLAASELRIEWAETGGPAPMNPPIRRGFGSALFERALLDPAGSRLEQNWARSGLIATLIVPRASLGG